MKTLCLMLKKKIKKYKNHHNKGKKKNNKNNLDLKQNQEITSFNRMIFKICQKLKRETKKNVRIFKNKRLDEKILSSLLIKDEQKLVFFNLLPGFNIIYGEKIIASGEKKIEVFYGEDEEKLFLKVKQFFK